MANGFNRSFGQQGMTAENLEISDVSFLINDCAKNNRSGHPRTDGYFGIDRIYFEYEL